MRYMEMMSTWRDANVFVPRQKITSREPAGETTVCAYDRDFFFLICKFLYKINPSGLMICVCVCLCPCLLPPRPAYIQTHSHGFTLAFLRAVCWVFNGRVKQQQMAISHCQ